MAATRQLQVQLHRTPSCILPTPIGVQNRVLRDEDKISGRRLKFWHTKSDGEKLRVYDIQFKQDVGAKRDRMLGDCALARARRNLS